jgi:hypothetical protein
MRHVGVLQGRTRLLVKLWSVGAQKQQRDGEVIELHPRMLASRAIKRCCGPFKELGWLQG